MSNGFRIRFAFTLIEFLVTIAIVSVLLGLVSVGVQSAREAARKVTCQNNLRQLGIAATGHLVACKFFPSGGWGYRWLGVAELGFGARQPGGWTYSLLPYLESSNTYNLVLTVDNAKNDLNAVKAMVQSKPAVFSCPARGFEDTSISNSIPYFGLHYLDTGRRTDYAANGGTFFYLSVEGPSQFADAKNYRFPASARLNGVCWFGSQLAPAGVLDGLSNTFFVGEKWVSIDKLGTENNQPLYSGDCLDVRRFTQLGPRPDFKSGNGSAISFGSRHHSGVNFSMCDGSTHFISYRIDESVFANLGNRQDGIVTEY